MIVITSTTLIWDVSLISSVFFIYKSEGQLYQPSFVMIEKSEDE